jgi:hypothetical protein
MAGSTGSWFDGDNKSLIDNWVQIMEERGLDPDTVEKRELAESPELAAAVRRQWAEKHPERASAPPVRRSSKSEEG